MSKITWDDLNQRQRYVLQYAIDKGYYISGRGNDDDIQTLERAGLIGYSGNEEGSPAYHPTNIGRALVASQQPASAPVADGAEVENTPEYWKQVAADNLKLAADNGDMIAQLQADLADARAALRAFESIWHSWQQYASSGDDTFSNLLTWLKCSYSTESIARWLKEAHDVSAAGKPTAESAGE